jgi:hypothetical protein
MLCNYKVSLLARVIENYTDALWYAVLPCPYASDSLIPFSRTAQPLWAYAALPGTLKASGPVRFVESLTHPYHTSFVLFDKMDHREEYHRDNVSSPRSHEHGQWSPPLQSQDRDQIYAAQGSPHAYSNSNSPPAISPPLPYEEYPQHPQLQSYEAYHEGYFNPSSLVMSSSTLQWTEVLLKM